MAKAATLTNEGHNDSAHLLQAIWTSELDPLFWRAGRVGVESAWYGHVPFAHWIVQATAPRCLVELGTHNAVSYSAFCEAVQTQGLGTRCFAIDTWTGDEQAGLYGDDIFNEVREYHDRRYGAFSSLIRCRFDDGLQFVADGSVDVLHIDGLHTYDAVRHDFESWRCKLSARAVVLFHDTNVRDGDFGVWRLWAELQADHPHFEFQHSYGLGVLAVGADRVPLIHALTELSDSTAIGAIRERFAQLGERHVLDAQVRLQQHIISKSQHDNAALSKRLGDKETELRRVRAELQQAQQTHAFQQTQTAAERSRIQAAYLQETDSRRAAEANLDAMRQSTTWKATWPLRAALLRIPPSLRRPLRSATRSIWRNMTPTPHQPRLALPQQAGRFATPPKPISLVMAYPAGPLRICYVSGEPGTPGTHYRVDRYVEACRDAGALAEAWQLDEVADRLAHIDHFDILVVWRAKWSDTLAALIGRARANGARIIFDVDDLMVDPALATVEIIDGIQSQFLVAEDVQRDFGLIQQTMLAADICTSSTPELTRQMRRFGQQGMTLPNGFSAETLRSSRMAVRARQMATPDGLVRVGYAGGSRTHQRDFAEVATSLPALLRSHPQSRLVLFRAVDGTPLIDVADFPELLPFANQIEWRQLVPLHLLPNELARFDINLAPLRVGNPFCEAKSELKYFEAALAGACTIASPTGPFSRAIQHGITGFFASNPAEWTAILTTLLNDAELRRRVGVAALNDVLWRHGPERRSQLMRRVLPQWHMHAEAAGDGFLLELADAPVPLPEIPELEVVFHQDLLEEAAVTVVIPLYNYARTIKDTLDSVRAQTLEALDLVIVDDASTDDSLAVALQWARANATRFNRLLVCRNRANAGLPQTRNAGVSVAETPYVLPLDADNLLRPPCCETLLMAITMQRTAFAYPVIQEFGERTELVGTHPYDPARLIGGNYIDAMALVAKSAWSAVGGYRKMQFGGWEDYDFWCALVERGLVGFGVGGKPLADYRAHATSMLAELTDVPDIKRGVIAEMQQRHPWLDINPPENGQAQPAPVAPPSCLTHELRHSRK